MNDTGTQRTPASADDALEATADLLHAASIRILRRVRVADGATGLSGPRLSALSVVVFRGPISIGDLAAAEQVRPATISRMVKDLEQEGLLRRRPDANDRRVQRVVATAAGRRLLQRGRRRRIVALSGLLSSLSASQRRTVHSAAELLLRVAGP